MMSATGGSFWFEEPSAAVAVEAGTVAGAASDGPFEANEEELAIGSGLLESLSARKSALAIRPGSSLRRETAPRALRRIIGEPPVPVRPSRLCAFTGPKRRISSSEVIVPSIALNERSVFAFF